ncbi:hypothetical protein TrVE_jg12998 [Triparma verrucosa]|uniref:P-type phospholipid transporter n=1 Tax=Triparma verrucosa TaxID=1606542 RepID=A0A9W7EK99_9STRA|nr:hypothetical protein TrVE_jg12998 [Triparma verrucosa]
MASILNSPTAADEEPATRVINVEGDNPLLCNNSITTNKYSFTAFYKRNFFFTKAVAEQFKRLGNIYFLAVGIIMFFGYYTSAFPSAITPWTTLGPLAAVVSVSLVNEALTDLQRHQSDARTNNALCSVIVDGSAAVLNDGLPLNAPTRQSRSGSITMRNREQIPADCILMGSSNPDFAAYVETSSIDGETNLKIKSTPVGVIKMVDIFVPENVLIVEPPNASVNTFSGTINPPSVDPINVDESGFLVRGSVLRNTNWAIGLVCYTGVDTKLMKNSRKAPSKLSNLDRLVNRAIVMVLLILAVTVTICASASTGVNTKAWNESVWYLHNVAIFSPPSELPGTVEYVNWIQNWFTYLTIFSNLVPLSLYVTLEVIIIALMGFVNYDTNMAYTVGDKTTYAQARSNTVSDLGQVKYIFSDKTGTLTSNVMKFKRCSVGSGVVGERVMQKKRDMGDLEGGTAKRRSKSIPGEEEEPFFPPLSTFHHPDPNGTTEFFIRTLALCHTVIVEDCDDDSPEATGDSFLNAPFGSIYQAESPDEAALVNAASGMFHFQLVARAASGTKIQVRGPSVLHGTSPCPDGVDPTQHLLAQTPEPPPDTDDTWDIHDSHTETWDILAVNKFDSTRKRMSVICRAPAAMGGGAFLFVKGADSSMLIPGVCRGGEGLNMIEDRSSVDLETVGCTLEYFEMLLQLQQDLAEFATDGLRTLVVGFKMIYENDLAKWLTKYKAASNMIGVDRAEGLTAAAISIESNIHILGATGIEDKLQDGVPDAIQSLLTAGIKLWVLTGDKKETAIEIGYSTNLLEEKMDMIIFDGDIEDPDVITERLSKEFMRLVKNGKLPKYSKEYVLDQSRPLSLRFGNMVRRCFGKQTKLSDQEMKLQTRHYASCLAKRAHPSAGDPEQANIFIKAKLARRASRRLSAVLSAISRSSSSISSSFSKSGDKMTPPRPKDEGVEVSNNDETDSIVTTDEQEDRTYRKKASRLERLFSVDKSARHGRLSKHVKATIDMTEEPDETLLQDGQGITLDNMGNIAAQTPPNRNRLNTLNTVEGDVFDPPDGALVITGSALKHVLNDPRLSEILFCVASCCKSVIACRVSPKQKAVLVKTVKKYVSPRPVTLAIGDGANDVGMIQEAQIGIGISGLEGQQAVNSSDFSIAQFRFLTDLLLVHGRWNYVRMAKTCMYSFYKNSVLVFSIFFFQFFNHWSGRPLYDEWVIGMFNFILGWPILLIGIFDRDISREFAKLHPRTYLVGRENQDLSRRVIFRWASLGILHAAIIYFATYWCYGNGMSGSFVSYAPYVSGFANGSGEDLASYGTVVYTTLIVTLTVKAMFETRSFINGQCFGGFIDRLPYTWLGIIPGTFGIWALGAGVYQLTYFATFGSVGGFFVWVPNHVFVYRGWNYLFIIVVSTLCIVVDVIVKIFGFWYFPSQTQIYCEMSRIHEENSVTNYTRPSCCCSTRENNTNFCCGFDMICWLVRRGRANKEMEKQQKKQLATPTEFNNSTPDKFAEADLMEEIDLSENDIEHGDTGGVFRNASTGQKHVLESASSRSSRRSDKELYVDVTTF